MKTKTTFIVIIFFLFALGSETGFAANQAKTSRQQKIPKILKLTQMVKNVHLDFRTRAKTKPEVRAALLHQKNFLLKQAEVREVKQLKGANLLVTFKDGEKLLMLLGKERLGGGEDGAGNDAQVTSSRQQVKRIPQTRIRKIRPTLRPVLLHCAPDSRKALIFDCLEDDANVVNPKAYQQVRSDLMALGYSVTTKLNNAANLSNAALIDDGNYGVVMMRGHGGDLGGDFGFLVRPWYDSWPPASGYTGTIRASAYNHAAGETQFGYVITGQFSAAYWTNKAFPKTMFFLESCHGADPGALPGMPTWTVNHGASVWLGWDESVSFNCGDKGTVLFFDKLRNGNNVGQALAAVHATGCRPPDLVAHPSGKNGCRLSIWKVDANEASIPNAQDFSLLKLIAGSYLSATISFYTTPGFSSFYFYVDTGGTNAAEVLVRCYPDKYEVNKQTSPGLYNNKVFTGTPTKSGGTYRILIPWAKAFGTVRTIRVWLYNMSVKDRLPNSGSVLVKK